MPSVWTACVHQNSHVLTLPCWREVCDAFFSVLPVLLVVIAVLIMLLSSLRYIYIHEPWYFIFNNLHPTFGSKKNLANQANKQLKDELAKFIPIFEIPHDVNGFLGIKLQIEVLQELLNKEQIKEMLWEKNRDSSPMMAYCPAFSDTPNPLLFRSFVVLTSTQLLLRQV